MQKPSRSSLYLHRFQAECLLVMLRRELNFSFICRKFINKIISFTLFLMDSIKLTCLIFDDNLYNFILYILHCCRAVFHFTRHTEILWTVSFKIRKQNNELFLSQCFILNTLSTVPIYKTMCL